MGFFGFVMAGGGSIGVLLGGVLTDVLSWHWIFLVNIPVGIAVFALSPAAPAGRQQARAGARPDRRRRRGDGDRRADRRRLRDRQRQRQRLALGRDARPARGRASSCSASSSRSSRASRPRSCRCGSSASAEPLGRQRRRRALVGRDVRLVLLRRAVPRARARLRPAARRARLPAGERHHGRLLARALGADRDALRHPAADRRRDGARLARAAAVRARARERELLARRAADDDRPRHRRRDGDEPGADRGDERRRAERVRACLRRSSTPPS